MSTTNGDRGFTRDDHGGRSRCCGRGGRTRHNKSLSGQTCEMNGKVFQLQSEQKRVSGYSFLTLTAGVISQFTKGEIERASVARK